MKKKEFLTLHKIALWDVLASCDIEGAADSSIKNPKVNDINKLLRESKIERIFTTGKTAYNLYNKYCLPFTEKEAIYLPSSSPANCTFKFEDLVKEYSAINEKG